MWSTQRIREEFLNYFKGKGHSVVPSSSLVPSNDPTLLFTNAGMVQFKNVFTGLEQRPYSRAVSSQKCVRAGGKHNDLENVGYTARHHTFFEMLGNFSFGDYFKEEAISYAWELVTKTYGFDPKRLLVTVYVDDLDATKLWRQIAGLPADRIIPISGSDNFWSMGDTGPCGPCSEIFFDHGDSIPGGPPGSPDQDGDRFVEIWNLVFMQYEQLAGENGKPGKRINLPKPSIDTGAGLERLAAALQGVHTNYDIDLFKHIIQDAQDILKADADAPSLKVIADHLRSCSFLIADGVSPSNEGRGYVLRRIMRRAMRHAYMMGAKETLMHKLVPTLVQEMGTAFPELGQAQTYIQDTLRLEEERFRETLGRGLKLLDDEMAKLSPSQALSGEAAFKLYDTFGFPLDLTQDILRAQNRSVDVDGFEAQMKRQKDEARKAWSGSGQSAEDSLWITLGNDLPVTEFLGYNTTKADGQVVALVQDGKLVDQIAPGSDFLFVTNQTPYYAESGGQMGDAGSAFNTQCHITISDCTKKAGKFHVHAAKLIQGALKVGDSLTLDVDAQRRASLRGNHSATHLLHGALRKYLGSQVVQKGSLVAPERLRFDFSYNQSIPQETLGIIEDEVNTLIRSNASTHTQLMAPEDAMKTGALALFGEKYGDEVRVVFMGSDFDQDDKPYSIEFCGGTHVHQTGDIGYFKIVSESGVAAGIRRIEALTGSAAEAYARECENRVQDAARLLKVAPSQMLERFAEILEQKKNLERDIKQLKEKFHTQSSETQEVQKLGSVSFLAKTLSDASPQELKSTADQMKRQLGSGILVLGSSSEGKASLVVSITQDLTTTFNAVDLVRLGAEALGGKGGGGRPDMAQAGGPLAENLNLAYEKISQEVERLAS